MKLSSLTMLMYELDVKVYGLMIGLLSICEDMELHMYIELVNLDWGPEQCLTIINVKLN